MKPATDHTGSRLPAHLRGKTAKVIETALIARRVDRIIGAHIAGREALPLANMLADALTFPPRDLLNDRKR